jgi:mycothiol synthase
MAKAGACLARSLIMAAALRRRAITVGDLPAVLGILAASDLAVLGRTDFTASEVEVDLRDADKEHVGWYDDAGALAAYGWVSRVGASNKVEIDVYVAPSADRSLGVEALELLESRGRELVTQAGHSQAVLDSGAYRQDERTRGWLAARGFEIGTSFARMRIDLDDPVGPPLFVEGATVRRSAGSQDDLRTAHALQEEALVGHYGHVARDFATWRRRWDEHGAGWCSLWLAELGGSAVGLLVGTEQFVEDEGAGYVRTLGVIPAGRGRGIAKALLRQYFAAQQEMGRAAVLLHVDVHNVTKALALYESVGMRPVLIIDAWSKLSPTPRLDSDAPL